MLVVSNSSPLIACAAIGRLDLFPVLFESILIPPAVASEIAPSLPTLPAWLRVEPLAGELPQAVLRRSLGAGERQALALAIERRADRIVLDDLPARRLARTLILAVIGTAGMLLAAKRRGLLSRIRPCPDDLVKQSFFVGPELYEELLRLAGEWHSLTDHAD